MARNFKELQEKMDPASHSDNRQRVRDELQRKALDVPDGLPDLAESNDSTTLLR
jgi:hypothetical protein